MKIQDIVSLSSMVIIFTIAGFLINLSITGFFAVTSGTTSSLGEQQKANPNLGAAKGLVVLIIEDPQSGVISEATASNINIYAVKSGFSIDNWGNVKSAGNNLGSLSNVDGDGNGPKCTGSSYTTAEYYEDSNGNGAKDTNEKTLNQVLTDANGCFAVILSPGSYDIYV